MSRRKDRERFRMGVIVQLAAEIAGVDPNYLLDQLNERLDELMANGHD